MDNKRYQDLLHTTPDANEQQKVKIAFAEGLSFINIRISYGLIYYIYRLYCSSW